MKIEFTDLGDWGSAELRAEYDPEGREPVIRVNTRVLNALPEPERAAFVVAALAHEFEHHREYTTR